MVSRSDEPAVRAAGSGKRAGIAIRKEDLGAYMHIGAAIVWRACLDARSSDPRRAAPARRWLAADPFAAEILDALDVGVDRRDVLEWLAELPAVRQKVLAL